MRSGVLQGLSYKDCVRLVRLLLYVAMTLIVEMTERWICAGSLARSASLASLGTGEEEQNLRPGRAPPGVTNTANSRLI